MAEVFGQASEWRVKELTGSKRQLVFAGRALPYRPVTFSGTMAAEFTWYPGNPEATVQVLGAREDETTFNGVWKDRFVRESDANGNFTAVAKLNGTQLGSVADIEEAVDSFRRQGQLLEVQWGRVVRHGLLTRFVRKWDRVEDLDWEATFTWTGYGEQPSSAVLSNQTDVGRLKADMDALYDVLQLAHAANPFDFVGSVGGVGAAIEAAVAQIGDRVNEVTDAVGQVAGATADAPSVARRLSGVYQSIRESSQQLLGVLRAQPPASVFNFAGGEPGLGGEDSQPTFGEQLLAEKYVRDLYDAGARMRRLAAEQQFQAAKLVVPTLIAIYVAKDGDDLRLVARAYYGSQEQWRGLATFNGLDSSALSTGQTVLVPRQETAQS